MSRFTGITFTVAGLWFVASVAFAAHQSSLTQFLSLLATLGLLVIGLLSFVRLFSHWSRERWRVFLPLGACFLVIVLALGVGSVIRHLMFERSLPQYESIIRQMEAGTIPVTHQLRRLDHPGGGPVLALLAQRTTNGVLTVEFITGGGFPVKHSGYLYCSSGVIESGTVADRRWPRRFEMRPFWYRVSD